MGCIHAADHACQSLCHHVTHSCTSEQGLGGGGKGCKGSKPYKGRGKLRTAALLPCGTRLGEMQASFFVHVHPQEKTRMSSSPGTLHLNCNMQQIIEPVPCSATCTDSDHELGIDWSSQVLKLISSSSQ